MEEKKVGWNELSLTVKLAVVGGLISLLSFALGFLIGAVGAYY